MNRQMRFGIRMAAGGVTVVGLAAVVVAALLVEPPSYRAIADPVSVTPEAADQVRVCPGSLLEVGQDASAATALTELGTATIASSTSDGETIEETSLTAPDVGPDASGPTVLTLPAGTGTMGASQTQSVGTDTIAGLAAAECQESSSDMWFVAGSTDVGRTSLVMLNNPTGVDAMVDIEVAGENGAVDSQTGLDVLVEAGTQKAVSLAGIAPNTVTPVVHVTSTGTDIQAWVQQSSIRGLVPAGVELAGRSPAPSESVTIPGVQVYKGQPEIDTQEYDDRRPSLRLYAPGETATHVTATVRDEAGDEVTTIVVDVAAGAVGEYPLTDVKPGRYSIQIEASGPVVAAARTSVAADKSGDFAWFAAADTLDAPFVVDAASGPGRTLVVHNPGADAATVTIGDDEVTIDPGASETQRLKGPVTVTPDAPVMASVSYAGSSAVSTYVVTAPKPASEPIDVTVR